MQNKLFTSFTLHTQLFTKSCGHFFVLVAVAIALMGGSWLAQPALKAQAASKPSALPYSTTAKGPYTVQGNKIIGSDGQQYIFHGIGRDGLEYNCSGEGPLDAQHLAYMGQGTNTSTETYWGANTIRLPLSEGFWLNGAPGYPCTAAQYQTTVKQVVDTLTALKLNVILDLQWSDAGGQSLQGGGPFMMPDADSLTFWQQVAPIYSSYSNVLFEVFNEPHPAAWSCWQAGCAISNDTDYSDDCHCNKTFNYQAVGMQTLVNTVRNAGANNLVLVAGMNWGYELSQIGTYTITGANLVYDTHPYPYDDKQPTKWDASFGNISETYAVISAESGQYDCKSDYMNQLTTYLDAHQIGWVAWAWARQGDLCGYPLLISDYQGTPAPVMGQYIYQRLRGYAPVSGPVNKTWYFAEGRVGASFKEYLTLENPDPINDCAITIQYLLEGGSPVTKSITVAHASRLTESVNADLNVPFTQVNGTSLSTIITVNNNTTPACSGVVAERPMYFSWHGINSGSDVMGATHLAQSFYFGDVPTGTNYTSFITILNPPGNQQATVTATYYVGGKAVGKTQSITTAAGQRATLYPADASLPTHVAAVVTSTQPVIVERPDYFSKVSTDSAHNVTGATSLVGAQSLANDWLIAGGNTGAGSQEYLVIANLDTSTNTTATVTITLEFANGTTRAYSIAVQSLGQVSWNVNQYAASGGVSAEVTSTGARIVVEREILFQYSHTINAGNSLVTMGGTDVIGQVGPASSSSYSFAEGYNNQGYNEWLTLQNPTASDESISLLLVNSYGRSYATSGIVLHAYSHYELDITALVLQNLVQTGDDYRGYEVAMTVQSTNGASFVAEREMYWNTGAGGTQGGSAVLGYAGL